MKRLLIVAHAPSPNTLGLRSAIENGARNPDIEAVEVVVKAPLEAGPEDILACDAFILGTTKNLGYMSGALKDLFSLYTINLVLLLSYCTILAYSNEGIQQETFSTDHLCSTRVVKIF